MCYLDLLAETFKQKYPFFFFLFLSPRPSQHPLSHLSCCVWQLVLGYRRTGASLESDAATRDPPISCSLTSSKQSMLPGHRVGANVIAFLEQSYQS